MTEGSDYTTTISITLVSTCVSQEQASGHRLTKTPLKRFSALVNVHIQLRKVFCNVLQLNTIVKNYFNNTDPACPYITHVWN